MKKIFSIFIFLVLIGCGDDVTNINSNTEYLLLLKYICPIFGSLIIILRFLIKMLFNWYEYVKDFEKKNQSLVNSIGICFAFHTLTFSSGTNKFCKEQYEKELKDRKIRCRWLFEKCILWMENKYYKKKDKLRKIKLKKQINEIIPGFLD